MRRIVHPSTGPTGPYAAWASNDELIFRTEQGVTSIKYVDKETAQIGNPYINIGQEIAPLLNRDPKDLLLFASLHVNNVQQRLAVTTWPVVDGPHRWHRGYVSAALAPGRSRVPEPMVWESVNTLPEALGEIIQFVEVRGTGQRRVFALIHKTDGTKSLAEWTNQWADDVTADGGTVPILWQLLTRRLSPGGEYSPGNFGDVSLSLLNIREKVDIKISARNATEAAFEVVYEGTFTNQSWFESDGYADAEPIFLGSILQQFNGKPWVQLLIQGTGNCVVDLAIGAVNNGAPQGSVGEPITCVPGEKLCSFDIFKRS